MATKKSSSKKSSSSGKKQAANIKVKDANETPAGASQASKTEERRPAPTVGDTAGAEFNPARTPEGEKVAQTGANPRASRAGVIASIGSVGKADSGAEYTVSVIDGGSVALSVGSNQGEYLTQSDAIQLRKLLDQAVVGAF